jgi:hypothetical protein
MTGNIYWMNGGGSATCLGRLALHATPHKPAFASFPRSKADRPDTSGNDLQ